MFKGFKSLIKKDLIVIAIGTAAVVPIFATSIPIGLDIANILC